MLSKFTKFFLFKELNRNGLRFSSAAASKKEKNVAIVSLNKAIIETKVLNGMHKLLLAWTHHFEFV